MRRSIYFLFFLSIFVLSFGASNAQSKMSVGAQGGIAIPMGDFGDAVDMGFGFQGNLTYDIAPLLKITGQIGYNRWSYKTDSQTSSGNFSTVPLLVGLRYTFPAKGFKPYLMAQLGLHFISSKITYEYLILYKSTGTGVDQATYEYSESSTKFGFGAGAGFLVPLGPKLDLDVNASLNSISTEGSSTNYINVMAGVLVSL